MDSDDETDALEERIAELTDAIERCRKISLTGKITAGAGAVYLAAAFLGLAPAMPSTIIAAMAAVLGGIVLLGSNASTWAQTETALVAAHSAWEATQADAPDTDLDPAASPFLRLVGDDRPTLH